MEGKEKGKKRVRVKRFNPEWLTRKAYKDWLAFDGEEMWCKWCREQKRSTIWATGTKNFRTTTVDRHIGDKYHTASKAARDPAQPLLIRGVDKAKAIKQEKVEAALRTVYWIATEEVANRKYESLLELQRQQGVEAIKNLHVGQNAKHTSPTTFNDLLKCLNEVIEEQTAREARASPWVAVGIDESTDRSSEKHLVLVVRYVRVHTAELVTTFLRCATVADGKAETLYRTMVAILVDRYGIPVRKVLGLGIDGAAVMVSDINGVTGLLHRDNPYTVAVHCVCHRLNLAVSQAAKTIQPIQNVNLLISHIYNYIMQSPNRFTEFKALVDVLGEDKIKLKNVFEVRWLSMGEAVHSVVRNFRALALYTGERAVAGDPGALGINQVLTRYLPLALLHLLADVLDVTNHLCKIFQFRDISFSSLRAQLTECLDCLETMRNVDGPKLERFRTSVAADGLFQGIAINMEAGRGGRDPVQELAAFREEFLVLLLENIRARFPRTDLLDAMKVFEPAVYPQPGDNQALAYWGRRELATLLDHYAEQKVTRDGNLCDGYVNRARCEGQFVPFKQMVSARFRGEEREDDDGQVYFHHYRPTELLSKAFGGNNVANQQIFGEVYKLMTCCLIVLISNAEAERVFSCQNRIKTKSRTLLSIEQLDRLIRLSYAKVPIAQFDFAAAREIYLRVPRRL